MWLDAAKEGLLHDLLENADDPPPLFPRTWCPPPGKKKVLKAQLCSKCGELARTIREVSDLNSAGSGENMYGQSCALSTRLIHKSNKELHSYFYFSSRLIFIVFFPKMKFSLVLCGHNSS